MRTACCLAAVALLAACGTPPAQPAPPTAPGGAVCDAAPAQFAIGRVATAALVEEVRQRSGARSARVLHPGQVVTMEFSAERVNLQVDASGRVTAVRCG